MIGVHGTSQDPRGTSIVAPSMAQICGNSVGDVGHGKAADGFKLRSMCLLKI